MCGCWMGCVSGSIVPQRVLWQNADNKCETKRRNDSKRTGHTASLRYVPYMFSVTYFLQPPSKNLLVPQGIKSSLVFMIYLWKYPQRHTQRCPVPSFRGRPLWIWGQPKQHIDTCLKKNKTKPGGNGALQYLGGRRKWISEFKASLLYRSSSRPARTIQRSPVWKNEKGKKVSKKKIRLTPLNISPH